MAVENIYFVILIGISGGIILTAILNVIFEYISQMARIKSHIKYCDKRFYALEEEFKKHLRKEH
jgi:hypothetical protein